MNLRVAALSFAALITTAKADDAPVANCQEGLTVRDLADEGNDSTTFFVTVEAGNGLQCETSEGTGDVSLLISDQETFPDDCSSFETDSNDEVCVIQPVREDTELAVTVTGTFAGVSLVCICLTPPSCEEGLTMSDLSGREVRFSVSVPAGKGLQCETSEGTGDAYLSIVDLVPTAYGCFSSEANSNNEVCTVRPALVERSFVGYLRGEFSGVRLVCSCVAPPSCEEGLIQNDLSGGLSLFNFGSEFYFAMSAGEAVQCAILGGTGDAQLYMGDQESVSPDDYCFSVGFGTDKVCASPFTDSNALIAVTVQPLIGSGESFSGVNLICRCVPIFSCAEGLSVSDLSSEAVNFAFGMEAKDGEAIQCKTSGGTGDIGLNMFLDFAGSAQACVSAIPGNDETCDIPSVTEDTVVAVTMSATESFSGVNLDCSCVGPTMAPTMPPTFPVALGETSIVVSLEFVFPDNQDQQSADVTAITEEAGNVVCEHLRFRSLEYFKDRLVDVSSFTCNFESEPGPLASPFVQAFGLSVNIESSSARTNLALEDAIESALENAAQDSLIRNLGTLPESNPFSGTSEVNLAVISYTPAPSPSVPAGSSPGCSFLPDAFDWIPFAATILDFLDGFLCFLFGPEGILFSLQ